MPVLIIGAACDIGRALMSFLLAQDAQVRVYVERDDPGFRSAGCKVAVGELDDIGRIESAMEQVHTVVHLAGGADVPRGRTVEWLVEETTDVAVRAAGSADVVRFLAVSEVGADPASPNPYLRARGRADEMIRGSGLQHAILLLAPVIGQDSPLVRALRQASRALAPAAPPPGSQRLNPLWAGDAAAALAAADARDAAVNGTWELGGPDVMTYDELVRRATGRKRVVHRRSVPALPAVLADAWRFDRVADNAGAMSAFGLEGLATVDDALALSLMPEEPH